MSVRIKSALLIFTLILIDQISKVYVKLNFTIGESYEIFSWFNISFVENKGAAFGMEIIGKLFLTIFRVVAVVTLAIYLHRLIMRKAKAGYIYALSLLLAGAFGNIVDSLFYGVLFSASTPYQLATFLPETGGYAPLFYGKVVDMFFFPMIKTASGDTLFFKYIFNVADSCVTVSAFILFLFYRKELNAIFDDKKAKNENNDEK